MIDPSGIIVTNNHVIDGADDIEINFNDGSKLKAKLIGRDKKVDVAVLVDLPKPLKAVKFAYATRCAGDWATQDRQPVRPVEHSDARYPPRANRDINSVPR